MEPQRVSQPGADVCRVEILPLDAGRLCYVRDRGNAVARVRQVSACFLGDAVLGEGRLALPVAFDLGAGCQAASGCGFGARSVGREVDVGGDSAEVFRHGFGVAGAVVEEYGYADGGFHHDCIEWIGYRLLCIGVREH